MINLAIFHQCFKEKVATDLAIGQFLLHNIDVKSKYYLVSDGGDNFSDVAKKHDINYFYEDNIGMSIMDGKTAVRMVKRLIKFFTISNCDYLMLMEDDVWCRGKLNYSYDFNAIGTNSTNNVYYEGALDYVSKKYNVTIRNNFFNLCGGSILNKQIFFEKYDLIEYFLLNDHDYIKNLSMSKISNCDYGNWDSTLNMLYIICGKEIGINEELTETWRDYDWKTNNKKLVHWYKENYANGSGYRKYYL